MQPKLIADQQLGLYHRLLRLSLPQPGQDETCHDRARAPIAWVRDARAAR
jgi:hypothetical protein